jgi:uncharacterized protein YgiM (DUF1202 family)
MKKTLLIILTLCSLCGVDCSAFTKYVTNNLNLRYEANAHSYILTVIPHQQACRNGRLVSRAIFKKKETSYVCCAFTVI